MKMNLLVTGLAGVLILWSSPTYGSAPELHIRDAAGDANGVNGQGEYGFELGVPTGPVQIPAADIIRVDLRRTRQMYLLSFRTSAPAAAGYVYGITAELSSCRIFIRHERVASGSETILYGCGSQETVMRRNARLRGNTLIVTIPLSVGDLFLGGSRMRAETLKLVKGAGQSVAPAFIDTASPG